MYCLGVGAGLFSEINGNLSPKTTARALKNEVRLLSTKYILMVCIQILLSEIVSHVVYFGVEYQSNLYFNFNFWSLRSHIHIFGWERLLLASLLKCLGNEESKSGHCIYRVNDVVEAIEARRWLTSATKNDTLAMQGIFNGQDEIDW